MDIAFHYFAIKALARFAGFEEREAQRIANFSQFIDDFNWITYLNSKNIPADIKSSKTLDLYVGNILTLTQNFNPATTGFIGVVDMASLLLERSQKFTVSPFHFVPPDRARASAHFRTAPAVVGDGSFISDELIRARKQFLTNENRDANLMLIGMRLHTFADTYAHQMFSGYDSWANDVTIENVYDNLNHKDITAETLTAIDKIVKYLSKVWQKPFTALPCIGHMWAGHVPDLTHVEFTMSYKSTKTSGFDRTYSRSNTTEFIYAAKEILNYLRSLLHKGPLPVSEWDTFKEKLRRGFLFALPSKNTETLLSQHWHEVFPEYSFEYDKSAIESSFYIANQNATAASVDGIDALGKNYSGEFYQYNVFADQMLVNLYGAQPRKSWFN